MAVIPVRLPDGLMKRLDSLVDSGIYSSRSDAIRDAIRKLSVVDMLVGGVPNTGDSVEEVRAIRKKLSKEKIDLSDIHKLMKEK